ncbi:MAG TPA: hypothetical protein VGE08_13750 [Steroidobacter sp.]|uniref:hypothetical protein n=1 Tax=Steroidobacter sp. TaxID=1978227 RepID=UPI002ED8985D
MAQLLEKDQEADLIQGEFFTDGKTFVFRLKDTPLSGTGNSPAEAFQDLVRVDAAAGALKHKLQTLQREQRGELVRATIIRMTMIGLITFGVLGGALVGAAALAPRVIADMVQITTEKLGNRLAAMSPEQERSIGHLVQKLSALCNAPTATPEMPASAPDLPE